MRALCLAATLAAVCLTPARATGMVVFESIQDPEFVGRAPGPDGFIGTPDDVPNALNVQGTVSWLLEPLD